MDNQTPQQEPLDDFVAFCMRHLVLITVITSLFAGGTLVYKLTSPRMWESSFALYVNDRGSQIIGGLTRGLFSRGNSEARYLEAVIKGADFQIEMAQNLDLLNHPKFWRKSWFPFLEKKKNVDRLLMRLEKVVIIKRREDNISISVIHEEKELAKKIADEVADQLERWVAKDYSEEAHQFDDIVSGTRKKLAEADQALMEFRKSNGLFIDEEQLKTFLENYGKAQLFLTETQVEQASLNDQISLAPGDLEKRVELSGEKIGIDASVRTLQSIVDEQDRLLRAAPKVLTDYTVLKRTIGELEAILEVQVRASETQKFKTNAAKQPYRLVTTPRLPDEPEKRGTVLATLIGAFLGFALAVGLANLIDVRRRLKRGG